MVCLLKRLHRYFRISWHTLFPILITQSASHGFLRSVFHNLGNFWRLFMLNGVEPSGSSAHGRQLDMNEEFMNKANDEMRTEYRREELGKGVRGKYFARVSKGSNLVLLDDQVAKAFPTGEAVNQALRGLLALTEETARITGQSKQTTRKRVAA